MEQSGVVLLHGLGDTARKMRFMARRLESCGYKTLCLSYHAKGDDFAAILAGLAPPIADFAAQLSGTIHFVGHSMGGLVARGLIHARRPDNLGRAVQLGTPNHGSALTDIMVRLRLDGPFIGRAVPLLSEHRPAELEAMLGQVDYPLGIIAGDFWPDAGSGWLLRRPNDGKVTIDSTKVEGMTDHIVLHLGHTFMPQHSVVADQVIAFLRDGRFSPRAAL